MWNFSHSEWIRGQFTEGQRKVGETVVHWWVFTDLQKGDVHLYGGTWGVLVRFLLQIFHFPDILFQHAWNFVIKMSFLWMLWSFHFLDCLVKPQIPLQGSTNLYQPTPQQGWTCPLVSLLWGPGGTDVPFKRSWDGDQEESRGLSCQKGKILFLLALYVSGPGTQKQILLIKKLVLITCQTLW